jgi:hypothetical protein
VNDHELDIWRVVFDTAVHSMDFGSGFLDDAEVEALRAAARLLGVDPWLSTPERFRCKYRGHHAAEVYLEHRYFDGPDGIRRNAYLRAESYPADVRGKLKRPGGGVVRPASDHELGMLVAPEIRMYCPDCGQRWDALEPIPPVNPQVTS